MYTYAKQLEFLRPHLKIRGMIDNTSAKVYFVCYSWHCVTCNSNSAMLWVGTLSSVK